MKSKTDPFLEIADQVADLISQHGMAFVEDDKIEDLANALKAFLEVTGIPVNN